MEYPCLHIVKHESCTEWEEQQSPYSMFSLRCCGSFAKTVSGGVPREASEARLGDDRVLGANDPVMGHSAPVTASRRG